MKKILFIRHAKSDWGNHNLGDIDRPLNKRGKKDAPEMGKRLSVIDENPTCIYYSPSVRTTQTINLLTNTAIWTDVETKEVSWLYHASHHDFLREIENLNNKRDYICLCGHNPGITDIVNYLSGETIVNMPTCAIALIEFKVSDWKEVNRGTGDLLHFDYPKNK